MITVNDIINVCNGRLISGNSHLECINFSKDTRSIEVGDIYVGIRGDVFDGNKFYKEAFNKGAVACIIDNIDVIDEDTKDRTIILVDNSIIAIQKLAQYKRSLYDIPVIAITGSVGKTSVKDMIFSVVSSKFNVLCTKNNFNNHIGLPMTILGLQDHDALIVEMGMNHFGELHILSSIAKPTIAVITTIGTAHIGILGSRENILKAKLEILDGMDNGLLIVNNDNDLLRTVKYSNMVTIGIDNKSDYMAKNILEETFMSKFKINNVDMMVPIGGKAYIYNALFAYAVAKQLNISDEMVVKALKNCNSSPHRMEIIKNSNLTIIDDTYNASIDSVRNALSVLNRVNGRKVFIFADILETDNFEENIHREIGKLCKEFMIDILITVGKFSNYTNDEVKDSNIISYHFDNNQELIRQIDNIITEGDTVLLKGSHSMNLLSIVNYLYEKAQ